ncbi:right-handed parallel beta-helix repeat-containing protein [Cystobacter fuscus]
MLEVSRAYWRVEGITFDAAGDRAFAAYWRGEGAHHGILRGCTLKNGTDGAGVFVASKARDVLIEGNTISNFQRSGADSHGVCVQTNSKNVTVRANDIHHNSGDGVQCLSSEEVPPRRAPRSTTCSSRTMTCTRTGRMARTSRRAPA